MKLSYLVLYSSDLEKLKSFYEDLGLQFKQEQHGGGSVHYSCSLDNVVLELYPGDSPVRLGFVVDNVKRKGVLLDPDGRKVDVKEKVF